MKGLVACHTRKVQTEPPTTFPETNISNEHRPSQKEISSSNHPCSGAMLVLGRAIIGEFGKTVHSPISQPKLTISPLSHLKTMDDIQQVPNMRSFGFLMQMTNQGPYDIRMIFGGKDG